MARPRILYSAFVFPLTNHKLYKTFDRLHFSEKLEKKMVPLFEVPQTIAELEDNSSDENIYRVHKSLKLDLNDVQSLKSVLEGSVLFSCLL